MAIVEEKPAPGIATTAKEITMTTTLVDLAMIGILSMIAGLVFGFWMGEKSGYADGVNEGQKLGREACRDAASDNYINGQKMTRNQAAKLGFGRYGVNPTTGEIRWEWSDSPPKVC